MKAIKYFGNLKKPKKSFHIYIRTCKKGGSASIKKESKCFTIQDYTGKLTTEEIKKQIIKSIGGSE